MRCTANLVVTLVLAGLVYNALYSDGSQRLATTVSYLRATPSFVQGRPPSKAPPEEVDLGGWDDAELYSAVTATPFDAPSLLSLGNKTSRTSSTAAPPGRPWHTSAGVSSPKSCKAACGAVVHPGRSFCDSLGNQRAVVRVKQAGPQAVDVAWRLRDAADACSVVVHGLGPGTQQKQKAALAKNSTAAAGTVLFDAPAAGDYAVYYRSSKWIANGGCGMLHHYLQRGCDARADLPSGAAAKARRRTKVTGFESRTPFDVRGPFDFFASPAEIAALEVSFPAAALVFAVPVQASPRDAVPRCSSAASAAAPSLPVPLALAGPR